MTSTRLVDQGDSLWLVWREGKRAQLYPCAVNSIVRSSPEATVVRLSFLQDNGVYQEPSEIALRSSARFDEGAMRSPNRAHMDWGYRTTSVRESDFKPSAHMASSSRGRSDDARVKRRGSPPVPEEMLERLHFGLLGQDGGSYGGVPEVLRDAPGGGQEAEEVPGEPEDR